MIVNLRNVKNNFGHRTDTSISNNEIIALHWEMNCQVNFDVVMFIYTPTQCVQIHKI